MKNGKNEDAQIVQRDNHKTNKKRRYREKETTLMSDYILYNGQKQN